MHRSPPGGAGRAGHELREQVSGSARGLLQSRVMRQLALLQAPAASSRSLTPASKHSRAGSASRRSLWVAAAASLIACTGAEFHTSDGVFELQTPATAAAGDISSETALRCDCRFIGEYAGTDYWLCPVSAAECLVAEH